MYIKADLLFLNVVSSICLRLDLRVIKLAFIMKDGFIFVKSLLIDLNIGYQVFRLLICMNHTVKRCVCVFVFDKLHTFRYLPIEKG